MYDVLLYVNKIHFLIGLCVEIFFYDVGKVFYKYCTSRPTFPISTLTIMFMYIMWCGGTYMRTTYVFVLWKYYILFYS